MLGLTLEETRIYQEAKSEGREEMKAELLAVTVPLLLQTRLTLEEIAQQLKVDIVAVQKAAQSQA